jgi:hypothetical protein
LRSVAKKKEGWTKRCQWICLGAAVFVPDWGRVVNVFSTHLTLSAQQQLQSAYEIHHWIQGAPLQCGELAFMEMKLYHYGHQGPMLLSVLI